MGILILLLLLFAKALDSPSSPCCKFARALSTKNRHFDSMGILILPKKKKGKLKMPIERAGGSSRELFLLKKMPEEARASFFY